MQRNKQIIFLWISLYCLIFDQLTKFLVNNFIETERQINILPNILSINKVYNNGAAFSLFQGSTIILITISLVALLLILTFVFKKDSKLNISEITGLAFIAGGAVGNLFDRIIYQHVIDFLQTDFMTFPIFNCADIFINIGVIILIVSIMLNKNDK